MIALIGYPSDAWHSYWLTSFFRQITHLSAQNVAAARVFGGGGATACVERGQCGVRVMDGELVRLSTGVGCAEMGRGGAE